MVGLGNKIRNDVRNIRLQDIMHAHHKSVFTKVLKYLEIHNVPYKVVTSHVYGDCCIVVQFLDTKHFFNKQ